jgi:hypothetical protein
MSRFSAYLDRQQSLQIFDSLILTESKGALFVTIPCYDEPDILSSLNSLAKCSPPRAGVTVIVVVNSSDRSSSELLDRNLQTISAVKAWWNQSPKPFFQLRLIHAPALPAKWAGVGWARKIAMDEAVRCLDQNGKEEGILIAFDADSVVTPNYFQAIESAFDKNPKYNFVNLNFSHPVDDPALSPSMKDGIILYELYLRFLRNALQWIGYPHAIHTVGSSFAVKASAYVKQGGMNRRQAGEDFHFLHKIVLLGAYGQINDATVYPAARISHRVPFGTGAALKKWEEGDPELHSVYALRIFDTLRPLLADPGFFYSTDQAGWKKKIDGFDRLLQNYLRETGTGERLAELKNNCADRSTFMKRFFHLINAFWIIQYLNLCEASPDGKGNLIAESQKLLTELNMPASEGISARELLEIFRGLDKKTGNADLPGPVGGN